MKTKQFIILISMLAFVVSSIYDTDPDETTASALLCLLWAAVGLCGFGLSVTWEEKS